MLSQVNFRGEGGLNGGRIVVQVNIGCISQHLAILSFKFRQNSSLGRGRGPLGQGQDNAPQVGLSTWFINLYFNLYYNSCTPRLVPNPIWPCERKKSQTPVRAGTELNSTSM